MAIIEPDSVVRADNYINESEKDAVPANDAGRVVKMESDGYVGGNMISPVTADIPCSSIVSAGVPKAVTLNIDGICHLAFGVDSATLDYGEETELFGFIKEANTPATYPNFIDTTAISDGVTYSSPAGNDRIIIVTIEVIDGSQSGSNVSGVTAGGVAMEVIGSQSGNIIGGWDSGNYSMWFLEIGDSVSAEDYIIDIAFSGTPDAAGVYNAYTIEGVDQDNAVILKISGQTNGASTYGGEMAYPECLVLRNGYGGSNTGLTLTTGSIHYAEHDAGTETHESSHATSYNIANIGVIKMASNYVTNTAKVLKGVNVPNFAGTLTAGALYYLSETTAGAISTTGKGQLIGIAKDTNTLFVFV